MYINGWNKEKVMAQIRLKNNGSRAFENEQCKYRTDNNNACLVGCFIPDEKYKLSMDTNGSNSAQIVIKNYNLGRFMPLDNKQMSFLQSLHDDELEDYNGEEFYKTIENYLSQFDTAS